MQCDSITKAIQDTVKSSVPVSKISPKTKCWWTKELTQLRKQTNKLGRESYRLRLTLQHRIHAEHSKAEKRYQKMLEYTKKHHWHHWLEKAKDLDIWTVHQIISAPASDGGKACILMLKHKVDNNELTANSNDVSKKKFILFHLFHLIPYLNLLF